MAIWFDGSSASAKLLNTATPITAYPFTVGLWALVADVGVSRTFWAIHQNADANHYWRLSKTSSNAWNLSSAGTTERNATTAVNSAVVDEDKWVYIIGRFVSATNRRLSVLHATGEVEHASNTTSSTPSSPAQMRLGSLRSLSGETQAWSGGLAEFFVANADIQADGAQTQNWMVWQLAYGGPFSVPHIVPRIIEYRSFRAQREGSSDPQGVYFGSKGAQVYTQTNPVVIGPHPPLPYWNRAPLHKDIIFA